MIRKIKPDLSFDNYELEPSPKVWENISHQLPTKNEKKRGWFWWITGTFFVGIVASGIVITSLKKDTPALQTGNKTVESPVGPEAIVLQQQDGSTSVENRESGKQIMANAEKSSVQSIRSDENHSTIKNSGPPGKSKGAILSAETQDNNSNNYKDRVTPQNINPESGYVNYLAMIPVELKESEAEITLSEKSESLKLKEHHSLSRWFLSFIVTAENNFRNISYTSGPTNPSQFPEQDSLSISEERIRTIAYEFSSGYSFNTHFHLLTGLTYFISGQERTRSDIKLISGAAGSPATSTYEIPTSAGSIIGNALDFETIYFHNPDSTLFPPTGQLQPAPDTIRTRDFELRQEFHYAGIPICIEYQLSERKLTPFAGIGVVSSFLLENKLYVNGEELNYQYKNPPRRFNLSAEFIAGIKYRVNNHFSVLLRPVYRISLQTIAKDNSVDWNSRSAGIGCGIRYRF